MTREQKIAKARELRRKGWKAPEIARVVEAPASTVRNWYLGGDCEKCGQPVDGSSRQRRATICSGCLALRNNERNQQIKKLWEEHCPAKEIAAAVGCSRDEVLSCITYWRGRGETISRRQLPHGDAGERYAQIALWVKVGKSNDEIAADLGTTPASVRRMQFHARFLGYPMPYRDEVSA